MIKIKESQVDFEIQWYGKEPPPTRILFTLNPKDHEATENDFTGWDDFGGKNHSVGIVRMQKDSGIGINFGLGRSMWPTYAMTLIYDDEAPANNSEEKEP